MKRKIRLTESGLRRIIRESVNRILMEQEAQEGANDLYDSGMYDVWICANVDDFVCDEIFNGDDDKYRAFCKWSNEVHFCPILLGRLCGSYDDPQLDGPDDESIKAFEYELSKLDSCPLFNEEEAQRIKDYINNEIDERVGDIWEWDEVYRKGDDW